MVVGVVVNQYEEGSRTDDEIEALNDSLFRLVFHDYERIHH